TFLEVIGMALKPLGDRIIVRFEETEEKTASGFVLAGASHETTKTAEVLAVGEGTRTLTGELIAPSIAVGDKVLVENGTGISVKDGEDYVSIIREADILAVLA
ncbi:co-chaperone GroES, partial [Vibrio campbellii]|uniref:co-chaperone GroES n=2 Tax=Bacteria TaxID=2 RepID=UPI003D9CA041